MPIPKPAWGTLPYLRRSRYHWKASSGEVVFFDAGLQEVVTVYALAAADNFAVALGGEDVYA